MTAEELRAERAAHIRRIVAEAPPLSPEQKARLAAIFAPTKRAEEDKKAV
jgi:hypothetical protein